MAIVHCGSFDHQVVPATAGGGGATTALAGRKWWDNANSGVAIDTTTFLHGTASSKYDVSAGLGASFQHAIGTADPTVAIGLWVNFTAGGSGTSRFIRFAGTSSNMDVSLRISDGIVYINGGTIDATAVPLFTPTPGSWYWVTATWDASANPHVQTARAYTTNGTIVGYATRSVAVAADTGVTSYAIQNANATGALFQYVDSYVCSDTATLLAPRRVMLLRPTGNGTNSFTDNDFQNQASTNQTQAGADFSAALNKVPPSTATFMKQVVIRSTGYGEVTFEDLPTSGIGEPEFVQLMLACHPVATNTATNAFTFHLVDGATVTAESVQDQSVAADTLEYVKHGYSVAPSTSGAWSTTLVNALKARVGYATDVTPVPAFDAIYLEVSAPINFGSSGTARKAYAARRALRNDLSLTI